MTAAAALGGSSPGLVLRNPRVQRLRRLARDARARRSEGAFVLEGEKLLAEALAAGISAEAVYLGPGGDGPAVEEARARGTPVHRLAAGVVERVGDAVSPQPVLAVVPLPGWRLADLRTATLVVVCVDVRDPGNLGSVIRSASAAGVGGVVCCDGTADPYAPKCVRASAGALFHVRLVAGGAPVDVLEELGSWGMRRLGTRPHGGLAHHLVDFDAATALVLGNEGHGLPGDVESALDGFVTIPMAGAAESLNVGAAAAVLCFEAARQRCP